MKGLPGTSEAILPTSASVERESPQYLQRPRGETERLDLQDDVSLQYYRLQRISSGPIDLNDGETIPVKSPTDVGTGKATEVKAPLSAVITVLNDRFGTEFAEEDRLF